MAKRKFAVVGASGRGLHMYAQNLASAQFADSAELVGVYDINPGRARYAVEHLEIPGAKAYESFYQMLHEGKPDAVIVTTVDKFHGEYAEKALEYGAQAIIEKPMCIDAAQVKTLLDTRERTGGDVRVTFNMRYMPYKLKVKELIASGVIGEVEHVDFEWNLIHEGHGTSYFRRWNGHLGLSGGLLLTKAAHHFDIANWYVDSYPAKVAAFGRLKRYGAAGNPFGEDLTGMHCHDCPHKPECRYYTDQSGDEETQRFIYDNAKYDGYYPDGCVFDGTLDAYDYASLTVQYESGVTMSYSLNANCPYEGWRIAFIGTKGRLEAGEIDTGAENITTRGNETIRVMPYNAPMEIVPVETVGGSHGGGDIRMLRDILEGNGAADPLSQRATVVDGAASVLLGAAANESIRTGETIDVTKLLGRELRSYR